MSETKICRLCVSACSNYKQLFEDLEVYEITVRYFDPMFLNQNDLHVVCYDCWCHIADFHNFQQTVTESQKKLTEKPKLVKINDTFQHNIPIKNEVQDGQMLTDSSPDSAYDDMLLSECIYGGENDYDDDAVPSELMPINNAEHMNFYAKQEHTGGHINYNSQQQSPSKKVNGGKTMKPCPGPAPLKCRFCPKISDTFASYRNHFCQKHTGKEFYVYCCGRKYQVRQQYESHLFLKNDFPYQCKACQKRFDLEITLVRHTRQCPFYKQITISEKVVQEFKCSLCGGMFSSESLLRQHTFKFHADRRYHCTYCDKSYTKSDTLREHMAKHTGNYLYKCNDCSLDFTYRSQWRKHMIKFHTS
ncbi:uncharacterized protein [Musca autumnalis]|uniref:uncharacterized protein n=1 Tax=Musca autumnalis TaxID=221902 RepID=UPI003CF8B34B